jgi:hypothetical protein
VGDERPKLSGDPRASAMRERAAVADVCPNAAAQEQQRNGQSKEIVHFKNSTLDSQTTFRVNRSIHLKATAREQGAQGRCDCWPAEGQAVASFSLGGGFARLRVVSGPR